MADREIQPGESRAKAALLERFSAWLDASWNDELPPIAAEISRRLDGDETDPPSPDLYQLWSAMTALGQETALQGRAFKELTETLRARPTPLEPAPAPAPVEPRALPDVAVLLDVRDRLLRGQEVARQARGRAAQIGAASLPDARGVEATGTGRLARVWCWVRGVGQQLLFAWRRWRPRTELDHGRQLQCLTDAVFALEEGYALGLQRVGHHLDGVDVHEIDCHGKVFDPERMRATAIDDTRRLPDGYVTAVYRPGYECRGRVIRHAEVSVARCPDAQPKG